ncbi:MAG: hypothetical protein AB1347_08895 [Acidobacteriota bacterium]
MRMRLGIFVSACVFWGLTFAVEVRGRESFVLMEAPAVANFPEWKRDMAGAGLIVRHAFPPAGGIVAFPEGDLGLFRLAVPPGAVCHEGDLNPEALDRLEATDAGRALLAAYLSLTRSEGPLERDLPPGLPLDRDALAPPDPRELDPLGACGAAALKRTTSEYMLGGISVNIILPESDGGTDTSTENWDLSRENTVVGEIVEGMNDLAGYYTAKSLTSSLQPTFSYHPYYGRTNAAAQTAYEPISRSADPNNDPGTGEGLWVREILGNLGYSSLLSKWDMGREFNGDTRIADGTDWAFTVFVADSFNDSDGLFADSRFAYAWLSGPYVVMTYGNDGWGISRMNEVTRHETCHIFHALDEYASSGCTCSQVSGYVNYANENCNQSCLINQNCIMNEANRQTGMCAYTAGQIGWGDADADNIPDPVDMAPDTSFTAYTPNPTHSGHVLLTGSGAVVARTSQSVYGYGCDVNILDVGGVSWRVNGGTWQAALPLDGTFDGPSEAFYFNASLAPGIHNFEAVSTDSLGQTDASAASTSVQVLGLPGVPDGTGPGAAMQCAKLDPSGSSIQVQWDQATCNPPGNHLVAGYGSGLPSVYGGIYLPGLPTSYCNLGTTGTVVLPIPFDPSTDPTRFIWWVMVPDGGSGEPWIEGSWGKNSGSVERAGPGAYGASSLCLASDKDTGVACGH